MLPLTMYGGSFTSCGVSSSMEAVGLVGVWSFHSSPTTARRTVSWISQYSGPFSLSQTQSCSLWSYWQPSGSSSASTKMLSKKSVRTAGSHVS